MSGSGTRTPPNPPHMLLQLRHTLEAVMSCKDKKRLLVMVAKIPSLGKVKTRLLTHLTPAEATDLYSCFIRDRIIEISRLKDVDLDIAYTPAASKSYFTRFLSNGLQLFVPQGRNPATGNSMMLRPRRVVTFKVSGKLRRRVNGS